MRGLTGPRKSCVRSAGPAGAPTASRTRCGCHPQLLRAGEFSGILSWSREHHASGRHAYLGAAAGGGDVPVYATPARAGDLAGLPPAIVQVGELEVFRDEDIDYATRLLQAGVPTELHVYPGAFHGWDAFTPEAAVTAQMVGDRFAAMRRALRP